MVGTKKKLPGPVGLLQTASWLFLVAALASVGCPPSTVAPAVSQSPIATPTGLSPTATPTKAAITAPGHKWDKSPNKLTDDLIPAFAQSHTVQLFSLEPFLDGLNKETETLQGFTVLGKCQVTGPEREELLEAFRSSIGSHKMTECNFAPHHGLRLEHNGHTYTALICFTCGEVSIFREDSRAVYALYSISQKKMTTFQNALRRHNLPVPEIERWSKYDAPKTWHKFDLLTDLSQFDQVHKTKLQPATSTRPLTENAICKDGASRYLNS